MNRDEYNALRAEINTHFQILNQYNLTTLVATAAGLAVARDFPSSWFYLVPLLVILPNGFNYASRREAVIR